MIESLWLWEEIKCFMQINCASNVFTQNNDEKKMPVTFPQTDSHSIYKSNMYILTKGKRQA